MINAFTRIVFKFMGSISNITVEIIIWYPIFNIKSTNTTKLPNHICVSMIMVLKNVVSCLNSNIQF